MSFPISLFGVRYSDFFNASCFLFVQGYNTVLPMPVLPTKTKPLKHGGGRFLELLFQQRTLNGNWAVLWLHMGRGFFYFIFFLSAFRGSFLFLVFLPTQWRVHMLGPLKMGSLIHQYGQGYLIYSFILSEGLSQKHRLRYPE